MADPTPQTTRRIGALRATDQFSEARIARALPPEHRIIGSMPEPDVACTQWLIEGPSLAPCDPSDPSTLDVFSTMHLIDGDRVRLTAEWQHCSAAATWTVGEWDSMDAYRPGQWVSGIRWMPIDLKWRGSMASEERSTPQTTDFPAIISVFGADRIYLRIHGIELGLTRLQAEALFLALGREFHPGDMSAWFPSAEIANGE